MNRLATNYLASESYTGDSNFDGEMALVHIEQTSKATAVYSSEYHMDAGTEASTDVDQNIYKSDVYILNVQDNKVMCVFSSIHDNNSKESSTTVRHRRYETRTSTTEQQRGQSTRHHRGMSSVRCRRASTARQRGANTVNREGGSELDDKQNEMLGNREVNAGVVVHVGSVKALKN